MLIHADEIAARPARTWYQSEYQKQQTKEASTLKVREEQEEARIGREGEPLVFICQHHS
jgi:hypothetical protein